MTKRSRLLFAALIGASIALVLGGGGAFYVGLQRVYGSVECAELSADECAFEHDISKSVGRTQLIFGIAMFALGLSMYVLTRRSPPPDNAATQGEKA